MNGGKQIHLTHQTQYEVTGKAFQSLGCKLMHKPIYSLHAVPASSCVLGQVSHLHHITFAMFPTNRMPGMLYHNTPIWSGELKGDLHKFASKQVPSHFDG